MPAWSFKAISTFTLAGVWLGLIKSESEVGEEVKTELRLDYYHQTGGQ